MNISIVVTFYYQDDTILDAIESLLKQDCDIKEIIIIDDGSFMKDEVKKKVTLSEKVKLFQIEHRGVSGARNFGIEKASSEFVFIADGDDIYNSTLVSKLFKLLNEDKNCVASTAWLKMLHKNYILKSKGGSIESFLCLNGCPGQILLKKEAWKLCGGYDERMTEGYEDWEFYIRLTQNGMSIKVYPEALIYYNCPKRKANGEFLARRLVWKNYVVSKHIELFKGHIIKVIEEMEALYFQRLVNSLEDDFIVQLGDGSIEALNNKKM